MKSAMRNIDSPRQKTRRTWWWLGLALMVANIAAGCGRSDSGGGSESGSDSSASKTGAGGGAASSSSGSERGPKDGDGPHARHETDGRVFYGKFPRDVWYDDPLGVAKNEQAVAVATPSGGAMGGSPAPMTGGGTPSPMPKPAGTSAPSAGAATDWKSMIALPILEGEVKTIQSNLQSSMQTVGKYNAHIQAPNKDIPTLGATIAALAAIAIEHPDAVSWKADAKFIRDAGTRIEESAKEPGKKAFDATTGPYEQMVALLAKNKPAGLPMAKDTLPFGECADRGGLMRRMEKASNYLEKEINTEAKLKSELEKIVHEATMLQTLTHVIAHKSYTSAEEKDYAGFAQALETACRDLITAAKGGNYMGYTDNLSIIKKKCDECHNAGYRFGN